MRFRGFVGLLLMAAVGFACGSGTEEVGSGVPCGEVSCKASEYCCDPSCGLCVEERVACDFSCDDVTS